MNRAADFCWVGADGALHSGSVGELMNAYLAGSLPAQHPVWRQGWPEWMLLRDVLTERRLERVGSETEGQPTLREPARFVEPETPSTLPIFERTLVDVRPPASYDPDATFEDVTQPLGRGSLAPPSLAPPTLRSEPLPRRQSARPPASVRPQARASLPPGGTALTLPPPAERSVPGWRLPAAAGAGLVAIGLIAAALIVLSAAHQAPSHGLRRGVAQRSHLAEPFFAARSSTAATCSVQGAPLEVSERIAPGASLHLVAAAGGRALLGVSSTERSGFGITLALDPLSVEARQVVSDPVHVAGVVPILEERGPKFLVDRFTRRVASFSLGMTPSGFARIADDGAQTTLWPGQAADVISRPVVAITTGGGIGVAFRRGSVESSVVRFGWLGSHGERQSDLATLSVASNTIDSPALASAERRVLLAYAVRQPVGAPWSIELATASASELPSTTLRFSAGDATRDQQHPALAALPGDRWLIAWAEGDRASGRRIRAQVLSATLAPLGAMLELAPASSPVGTLAIHAEGARAVVLFSERTHRQSDVLRAVAVSCP